MFKIVNVVLVIYRDQKEDDYATNDDSPREGMYCTSTGAGDNGMLNNHT